MTKRKIKLIVFAFFTLLIIIFTVQNTEVLQVKFLFWDVSMSKSLLVMGLWVIGFIMGRLIRFAKHRKKNET